MFDIESEIEAHEEAVEEWEEQMEQPGFEREYRDKCLGSFPTTPVATDNRQRKEGLTMGRKTYMEEIEKLEEATQRLRDRTHKLATKCGGVTGTSLHHAVSSLGQTGLHLQQAFRTERAQ